MHEDRHLAVVEELIERTEIRAVQVAAAAERVGPDVHGFGAHRRGALGFGKRGLHVLHRQRRRPEEPIRRAGRESGQQVVLERREGNGDVERRPIEIQQRRDSEVQDVHAVFVHVGQEILGGGALFHSVGEVLRQRRRIGPDPEDCLAVAFGDVGTELAALPMVCGKMKWACVSIFFMRGSSCFAAVWPSIRRFEVRESGGYVRPSDTSGRQPA